MGVPPDHTITSATDDVPATARPHGRRVVPPKRSARTRTKPRDYTVSSVCTRRVSMRSSSRTALLLSAFLAIAAAAIWASTAAAQTHDAQHEAGEHQHAEAAAMKNPVKATPDSIAAGKAI